MNERENERERTGGDREKRGRERDGRDRVREGERERVGVMEGERRTKRDRKRK